MDTKKLRQKVLDLAIHGKLVPQEGQRKTMSLKQIISLKSGEGLKVRELDESGLYPIYGGNGINGTYNTYNVEKGTLLIGRVGFYCGSIHKTISKSWVTDNALIVKINCNNIDLDFLKLTLISLNLRNTSNSTAQPVVSGKGIYPLIVEIPPLAEQHRIVKAVDELFEQIDIIERSEKELEEAANKTRDKLLNLAIQGHLVPQDPNEEPASVLLERIRAEKTRLVKEGKLKKKDLEEKPISPDEIPFDIPEGWVWTCMKECNYFMSSQEDPTKKPEKQYELYSVPTFETGMPEFVKGKEISSSKVIVQKNDVLLCKINPHLNRSWVVSHYNEELPCIASSEWIVFRNHYIYPKYLRYCFISPYFKNLMMSNVSGVGGSLMRAQPVSVAKYLFPLPPLSEQRRIVTKLEELLQEIDKLKT